MRVTSEMLSSNFLYDLNNSLNNMSTDQNQMATGTKISEPSDDPLGTSKVMNINTQIAQNTQYSTNITDATNNLDVTDSTLGEVTSVLQRINELLVSTGDASYGSAQLTSVNDEINQEVGQASQLLNTNYGGKYIFAGTSDDTKPTGTSTDASGNTTLNYVGSDGTTAITQSLVPTPPATTLTSSQVLQNSEIANINSPLSTEISQGVTLSYNVTAGDVMNFTSSAPTGTGTSNLMDLLSKITSDLSAASTTSTTTDATTAAATSRANLVGADLTNIQDAIENVSNVTTKLGAMEDRMSSATTENQSQNTDLTQALSSVDDIDYADASMNFSQAQTVYQAALQTSAKVLQNSLLDYLT
jgi:flagellar hook-associated protein 3 FlgL